MSCISVAGWVSGIFNDMKFSNLVTISCPCSTIKPILWQISSTSLLVLVKSDACPVGRCAAGIVPSTISFSSCMFISASWSSLALVVYALVICSLALESVCPSSFFSSGVAVASFLNRSLSCPFFPR